MLKLSIHMLCPVYIPPPALNRSDLKQLYDSNLATTHKFQHCHIMIKVIPVARHDFWLLSPMFAE